jgi:pilus assembly protein CpaF
MSGRTGPCDEPPDFLDGPFTVDDLITFGTLTRPVADVLTACVRGRLNILIGGGPGAGKTTTLNVLGAFIPGDERIVMIEEAAELRLGQKHVFRPPPRPVGNEGGGEVRTRDLVRNSLRMRPDRIVIGEIRGTEALDVLGGMIAGLDGWIATVHANAPRDVLSRLETMALMASPKSPVLSIRGLLTGLDLILQQTRYPDGSHRITHITEVVGMSNDLIILQDIFVHDGACDDKGKPTGILRATGIRPGFLDRLRERGIQLDPAAFSL